MRTVAKIELANCYFKISNFHGEFGEKVIKPFCKAELTKFEMQTIPNTRHKIWKPTHVFARSDNDQEIFRLPKNVLEDFLKMAEYRGYNRARISQVVTPEDPSTSITHALREKYMVPREHQVDWIKYQLEDGPLKVNNCFTGGGKGSPVTSKVKTPGGWLLVRDLEVGQTITAWDGTPTKITGVHPQGEQELYRVMFEDYRYADVDRKHMWEIFDYNGPDVPGADTEPKRKVVDIEMLMEYCKSPERLQGLYIPLCKSEKIDHSDRMERLQTLIGNNWRVGLGGEFLWDHPERSVVDEVINLVRSIGGIATYLGFYEDANNISILVSNPEDLVKDEFSKRRLMLGCKRLENPELKIRSVVKLHKKVETVCISIDHPSKLFIIDDYVVTHNTYMGLFTGYKLETRVLITIQPRYIPVWQKDIGEMFDVVKEDVVIWEFSDLARLAEIIKTGKVNPKMLILPTTRISTYLKNQRKDRTMPTLDEVFRDIGAGLRIIDEGHESFHEVAVSMMYGNPAKTIVLSATLKADDPFLNRMYLAMIPKAIRLKEPADENYIDIVAYLYDIDTRRFRLNTMQNGAYSDIALEKSILKDPKLMDFYFELADSMYKEFYLNVREEGTKCIFFFTMIEMCLQMKERFRERYPGDDFDTYLGTLDKKTPTKYMEHEILITTPGSCGTGKDIPGLVTAICPHTVFSTQRNKQIIGRLRDLLGKFGGRITPLFAFPVCKSIGKHHDCVAKRKIALASKQKTFRRQESGLSLVA